MDHIVDENSALVLDHFALYIHRNILMVSHKSIVGWKVVVGLEIVPLTN